MRDAFVQMQWRGWPKINTPPSHTCYHAKSGLSALKGVGINTGNPANLRSPRTLLSWDGRRGWHTRPSIACYLVKFGSSASKGVCINRSESINWGALGKRCPLAVGAWVTPRNTPLPTRVSLPSFIVLRQNVSSLLRRWAGDPPKNLIPRVPRFKVTQGHRKRRGSIRRLELSINVT